MAEMSQKQDRINDVLAQRISQLEDELRTARHDLSSTLAQKERVEQDMQLLKDEAFEVVEQWSAENNELRGKLAHIEQESTAHKSALETRDEVISCLKEELSVAQQLATQYSTDTQEQQRRMCEMESENKQLVDSLESVRSELSSSLQRVADYERLVAKFQVELKGMLTSRKEDADALEQLRASLAQATAENQILREAGASVSSSTERLLERVTKLKEENEAIRRGADAVSAEKNELVRRAHRDHEEQKRLTDKSDALSARLETAEEELRALRQGAASSEEKLSNASAALSESQAAAEQQMQLIQTLERDVQELRDGEVTAGKAMRDLQDELQRVLQQLSHATKLHEDLETEHNTIKENYATLLMEFDDHKRTSASALAAVHSDYAAFKRVSTERCTLAEQNCNSAWLSVQELTGALRTQQLSELVQKEQVARSLVALEQSAATLTVLDHRHRALHQQMSEASRALERAEERIQQGASSAAKADEMLSVLSSRCRASEQTVAEQRRGLSALESQLSQYVAQLKETALERDAFSSDNVWLREQVESMRQELGELDELLNANLNEMREENERLQLDNDSLKHKVTSSEERQQEHILRITSLETSAGSLESELRAQSKTLELTEAELQAVKAQADSLSTKLSFSQARCEELETLNAEATQASHTASQQVAQLQERLNSQEARLSLILSDRRKESDGLKLRLNALVEKCEELEQQLRAETKTRKDAEAAGVSSKEQNTKLRSALDELKGRCASDASALTELLAERDDLLRDRDVIVEKYNKLHDAFRNVRKEAHGKVAEELKRVMELAISQEAELQTLRQQNATLKKSVSMFVDSAQPKAEAVFTERLNLTEGPLRHPKKRSAANTAEPQ
ncbi:hypothetical protein NESM_000781600 [Novymonas esmeraldas]|uniref:Uncharacterized protein n=1 Tax=Novymonas esmeraldas TaxID=1808958 RepID=A0AAW0EXL5_9TRYP